MDARYYDPVIGRFYSNDPVGFTGDITTFNRYSYVGNNPYKYTDPTGMFRNCGKAGSNCTVIKGSSNQRDTFAQKRAKNSVNKLYENGTLNATKIFNTEDNAAKEVLTAIAPISRRYKIELGGNIKPAHENYFSYGQVVIGDALTVGISPYYTGYHTHYQGGLIFSNYQHNEGDRNDAGWVRVNKGYYNNGLYLGYESDKGVIGIALCTISPSCGTITDGGALGIKIK